MLAVNPGVMQRWSRRRTLQSVAATATAALAGCNADSESGDAPRSGPDGDPVSTYDALSVRTEEETPPFRQGDDSGDDPSRLRFLREPVADADLSFTDGEAAAELAAFARDTDFERQSVVLYATRIATCYDLTLERVAREPDGVSLSLCRRLRPADVACDEDASATVGLAVRFPFPADDASSTSISTSSACGRRPEPLTVDGGGGA